MEGETYVCDEVVAVSMEVGTGVWGEGVAATDEEASSEAERKVEERKVYLLQLEEEAAERKSLKEEVEALRSRVAAIEEQQNG